MISAVTHPLHDAAVVVQRLCKQKIAKGALRFGIETNIMGNLTVKWRHVECCTGYQAAEYTIDNGSKRMVSPASPSCLRARPLVRRILRHDL